MQEPSHPLPARGLTVGQVAARAGLAVSAIHFYESKGLIHSSRNPAGHRRFDRAILRRLAIIRVAQRLGIPLEAIAKAFATLPKHRAPNAREWAEMSAVWHSDLSRRIEQLTVLRDRIDFCIGCGCLSVTSCPLYNEDDKLAATGSGARRLGLEEKHD